MVAAVRPHEIKSVCGGGGQTPRALYNFALIAFVAIFYYIKKAGVLHQFVVWVFPLWPVHYLMATHA